MFRSAPLVLAALLLGTSACTVTLGTGAGAQQPQQPVVYYEGSTNSQPQQPQPVVATGRPAPVPVGVSPAPAAAPSPSPSPTPRHVGGTWGWGTTHTGLPVLPRGSTFGGDGQTFTGTLYFIPVGSPKVPDFSQYSPQALTYTDHLNVPLSNAQGSLTPWPDKIEGFGFRYEGKFTVAQPGTYSFAMYADTGANLYVDGVKVVDNDGIHDPRRADGTITLSPGAHSLRVDWYLAYRWTVQLQVFVTPPNGNQELFGPAI